MSYRNSGRYGGRPIDESLHRSSGSYQPVARRSGSSMGPGDLGGAGGGSWSSGRHSWGSSSHHGGMMPAAPPARGPSMGHPQSDTLNVAASLVSALLQNQRSPYSHHQQHHHHDHSLGYNSPRNFSATANYRSRSDSYRGAPTSSRYDSANKFASRRDFSADRSHSRGRTSARGPRQSESRRSNSTSRRVHKSPSRDRRASSKDKSAADYNSDDANKEDKTSKAETSTNDAAEGDTEADKDDDVHIVLDSTEESDKKGADEASGAAAAAAAAAAATAAREHEHISSEYLNCHLCQVNHMAGVPAYMNHLRGHSHRLMVNLMESRLKHQASLIRVEIQMANNREEVEYRRKKPCLGRKHRTEAYCSMCEVHVFGTKLVNHRNTNALHIKLKNFLHPRCCGIRFDTPVLYELHQLSIRHCRRMQQRDKEMASAGVGLMAVAVAPKRPAIDSANDPATDKTSATDTGVQVKLETSPDEVSIKPEHEEDDQNHHDGNAADVKPDADADMKPKLESQEEQADEEEEIPAMHDENVPVGLRCGQRFHGLFCPACYVALPVDSWEEHCKSYMHFTRYASMLRTARRDRENKRKVAARWKHDVSKQEAEEHQDSDSKQEAEQDQGSDSKRKAEQENESGAVSKKFASDDNANSKHGDDEMNEIQELDKSENGASHGDEDENAVHMEDEDGDVAENGVDHSQENDNFVQEGTTEQENEQATTEQETEELTTEPAANEENMKNDSAGAMETDVAEVTEPVLEVEKSPARSTRASRGGVARRSRPKGRRS